MTKVRALWEALGSHVEIMGAAHHDLVLAITSHVPHLIAYNIVGTAADLEEVTRSEVIKFSAGGFRDFTRIAASDPTMWRDVFLHNKDAVLEMLGRFNEDLTALAAHDPSRRRRRAVRAVHPDASDPARHCRAGPGDGGARFRAARSRNGRAGYVTAPSRPRFGREPLGVRVRVADVAARIHLYAPMQGDAARLAEKPMHLLACLSRLARAARPGARP